MTDSLYAATGALPADTRLEDLARNLAPEISLLEPAVCLTNQGRGGAVRNLRTVTTGPPDLMGVPVAELRLCWQDGAVHFVAYARDIRWAAFGTRTHAVRCPEPAHTAPVGGVRAVPEQTVLWRSDLAGRFLASDAAGANDLPTMMLRRFDRGPRTVAWWLVISPGSEEKRDG